MNLISDPYFNTIIVQARLYYRPNVKSFESVLSCSAEGVTCRKQKIKSFCSPVLQDFMFVCVRYLIFFKNACNQLFVQYMCLQLEKGCVKRCLLFFHGMGSQVI